VTATRSIASHRASGIEVTHRRYDAGENAGTALRVVYVWRERMVSLILAVACAPRAPVASSAPETPSPAAPEAPTDDGLEAFRDGAPPKALRQELAAIAAPAGIDDLGRVLAARRAIDQRLREAFVAATSEERSGELGAELRLVDEDNTAFLKAWVAEHGWPRISEVGEEVAFDAWLLAQHADHAPAFQEDVLQRMGTLVEEGEAKAKEYAYLWDRVALARDRPQRYATQGACQGPRWEPADLEEPEGIEARRAEFGLGSLDAYRDWFDCDRHQATGTATYEAGEFATCEVAYAAHAQTRATRAAAAVSSYNAACCAAMAGHVDAAFAHLEAALEHGFGDAEKLETDTDLQSLRQDPRWAELVSPP
jgi:hypothetical protein